MMRPVSLLVSMTLLVAGAVSLAPPASAACGYGSPVELQSAFTSQTYAGVQTTTKIPYVFKYADAGCLQGFIFTFVGGGGTDVQAVRATVTGGSTSGEASAAWLPKPLAYKLLVDVVYEYGPYGTLTTSRWTYESLFAGNAAFTPLPTPSAPSNPRISTEDRTVSVQWGPPAVNPGAVTTYKVRRSTGEPICEVPPGQFACTIADQPDGTYVFIVSATNQIGAGSEVASPGVKVGPPNPPGFSSVRRVSRGVALQMDWSTSTGTSARARVYRVYDQAGREVCGLPVTEFNISAGSMSCRVRPAKSGSSYKIRVETNLGVAESGFTAPFRPRPVRTK